MSNPWWLGGRERSRMYDANVLYTAAFIYRDCPVGNVGSPVAHRGAIFHANLPARSMVILLKRLVFRVTSEIYIYILF